MKIMILIALSLISSNIFASEINQQFKDPAFSGIGWSSHMFTVYQTTQAAKQSIVNTQASNVAIASSAASNTPAAKFMNLFQSQIYSQLATQLSNSLFSTCTTAAGAAISGCTPNQYNGHMVIDVSTGTSLDWQKLDASGNTVSATNGLTATQVQLNINGTRTNTSVTVPIASFAF